MFEKPSVADLREAATRLGMNPSDAYLEAAVRIVAPLAAAYAALDAEPDEIPVVREQRAFSRREGEVLCFTESTRHSARSFPSRPLLNPWTTLPVVHPRELRLDRRVRADLAVASHSIQPLI